MTTLLDVPEDLPIPLDDGAADHLRGMEVPDIALPATTGGEINIRRLGPGPVVLFAYPRTGVPGEPLPDGWNDIPGARGCTPQNCAFRDLNSEFAALGAKVIAVSTNSPAHQLEMATRLHLPYPVLSDEGLLLTRNLRLPTFEVDGMTLLRRLTIFVRANTIVDVDYPVFPPDKSAETALSMLRNDPAAGGRQ